MRTNIYVDGFNLYYGSLRGTSYKWLDLKQLFQTCLGSGHSIQKLKYYTAKISARPEDPDGPMKQDTYLRALKAHIPELDIILGHFIVKPVRMPLVKPTVSSKTVEVMKTEEKGSDVNLAVDLLNDAWMNSYECAVVVSNDGDLAGAMRLVKKQGKRIVVLAPGDPSTRPHSVQLTKWSHKITSIPLAAIAGSQLPNPIPNTTIHKPKAW
jgi:uncharacterized LabA/DUF88 family protein